MQFLNSLQSEWLKTKNSAASWLCLAGGFFLPVIFLIGFFKNHNSINKIDPRYNAWLVYNKQIWEFMGFFLLPMGVVLTAGLIAQIEYRNNSWKQVHATPQTYLAIFLAKFLAILGLVLKFFLFFNIGMLVSAIVPSLLFEGHLPRQAFPFIPLLRFNALIFITTLPVLALHYMISLLFRNFLVPVGLGLLGIVGSILLLKGWSHAWLIPYTPGMLLMMGKEAMPPHVNIYALCFGYFAAIMTISYFLYSLRKAKG